MGSTFKGLSEVLGPNNIKSRSSTRKKGSERVLLGHVLDVVLDSTSQYFNSEYGIGAIRFRAIPEDYKKPEADIDLFAFPIDRARYQVPLPGEQVAIYPIIVGTMLKYAYGTIIKQSLNIAYGSEPFLSTTAFDIDKNILDALVNEATLATRFKDKLQIPYEDYENSSYGVMSLREGDMIFEGRFGSSILFTSTMDKIIVKDAHSDMHIGDDDFSKQQTTEDGDPVLIIQANKKLTANDPYLIKPSINKADSIVYMTSTQIIPMEVATSRRMDSWNVKVTRPKVFKMEVDPESARLQSFFDGAYDPNSRFAINLNITGIVGGGGGAFGDDFDYASIAGGDWSAIAAKFISKKEGFTEVATFDENAYRAGYGSDKIVKNGALTTVTQGMTVTKEEAVQTLAQYSIPEFVKQIVKDLGEDNWNKLNNNQKAALTSLGYNVGKYYIGAKEYGIKIKNFIKNNQLKEAGDTIYTDGPKSGAKSGPLPGLEKRRREESQLFNTPV